MDSVRSLQKITQKINCSDSSLGKLRELIDLEIRTLPIEDLTNLDTIHDFLNILAPSIGEYAKFIHDRPVYFLLRKASFHQQLPLDIMSGQPLQTFETVMETLKIMDSNKQDVHPGGSGLDNHNLLSACNLFIKKIKKYTPSDPPPITMPPLIRFFPCVEEIMYSCYVLHWNTFPSLHFQQPDWEKQTNLENWLFLSYLYSHNFNHNIQNMPDRTQIASKLISNDKNLFFPMSTASETFLTLPISKQKAIDILETVTNQSPQTENIPILAFGDVELDTMSMSHLFLYDHIIEALCNYQSFKCSRESVEGFINKATQFIIGLEHSITTIKSNQNEHSLEKINKIRTMFLQCGLTETKCETIRTVLVMTTSKVKIIKWNKFRLFFSHLNFITLFANYFYLCLHQYSPTSISFNSIKDTIALANLDQAPSKAWTHPMASKLLPSSTIRNNLRIFIQLPPEQEIVHIYNHIHSSIMKSMFSIWAKRTWGITKLLQSSVNESVKRDGFSTVTKSVSEAQVNKYCEDLEIGESDYTLDMVKSQYFAQAFIKYKISPILSKILRSNFHKNRALFQLRWLIIFAYDDAVGLYTIRKPMTSAYFQITEIVSQSSNSPFLNLLDHFQEIFSLIRDIVPDAIFSDNFLTFLFTTQYSPVAQNLVNSLTRFIGESETLSEGLLFILKLSDAFCHTTYTYSPFEQQLEMPIKGSPVPLKINLEVFKTTIKTLEQSCQEAIAAYNQLFNDLNSAYISLGVTLKDVDQTSMHSIQIETDEPKFTAIYELFLKCFKHHQTVLTHVSNSCAYILTQYFHTIFDPDLIPIQTIKKVLEFSDGIDNPQTFLEGFLQPVEAPVPTSNKRSDPLLTVQEILQVKELYDKFPTLDEQEYSHNLYKQPIKLNYTDKFDISKIEIDWDTYKNTFYLTQEADSPLTIITAKDLKQAFVSY